MTQPRESATNVVARAHKNGAAGIGNLVQQRVWQKRGGGSALESAQRIAGTMGSAQRMAGTMGSAQRMAGTMGEAGTRA